MGNGLLQAALKAAAAGAVGGPGGRSVAVVVLDEGFQECGASDSGTSGSARSGGGCVGTGELDDGAIAAALKVQPAEGLEITQIGPQLAGLQVPGLGELLQPQLNTAVVIGAPLQVAVELGDTQGTAGAMAATALLQGLQCAVGVVDGGGADGVEAHAEISRACSGRERLPALAAAQRLALETRAGGSDLEPGGGGSGLKHSSLILDPRSLIPDL
jgi:hypothetical protein